MVMPTGERAAHASPLVANYGSLVCEKLKGNWALPEILEAFLVDGRALVGPLVRSA